MADVVWAWDLLKARASVSSLVALFPEHPRVRLMQRLCLQRAMLELLGITGERGVWPRPTSEDVAEALPDGRALGKVYHKLWVDPATTPESGFLFRATSAWMVQGLFFSFGVKFVEEDWALGEEALVSLLEEYDFDRHSAVWMKRTGFDNNFLCGNLLPQVAIRFGNLARRTSLPRCSGTGSSCPGPSWRSGS